jgi:hypothetical protein
MDVRSVSRELGNAVLKVRSIFKAELQQWTMEKGRREAPRGAVNLALEQGNANQYTVQGQVEPTRCVESLDVPHLAGTMICEEADCVKP